MYTAEMGVANVSKRRIYTRLIVWTSIPLNFGSLNFSSPGSPMETRYFLQLMLQTQS